MRWRSFTVISMICGCVSFLCGYTIGSTTAQITREAVALQVMHTTEYLPLEMKVTGYSNDSQSINVPRWRDGHTATGTVARVGIAAADWEFYPPGTAFYVPGYGRAVVEDCGSAVKGKDHIDLFFSSREEALQWGNRKSHRVYQIKQGGA